MTLARFSVQVSKIGYKAGNALVKTYGALSHRTKGDSAKGGKFGENVPEVKGRSGTD